VSQPFTPAEWHHRGCVVRLEQRGFLVQHGRGIPLGRTDSLAEARDLIDERILLLRQRLAASA
jgi:hypothetical protein